MINPERLPPAASDDALHAIVKNESVLRPGVDALAGTLGLDVSRLRRLPNGSLPVYADEHRVLKLFPPVQAEPAAVEIGVLKALTGQLPVATPAVHADGEHDGWRYVLMDRLPGVDLSTVWADLPHQDRCQMAAQAGDMCRILHQVPAPAIKGWWPVDWSDFVADQRMTAVQRHREWLLPQRWLEQVDTFLNHTPLPIQPLVVLHTEIMPANLLAIRDKTGRWALSGLCDLEPAMRGTHEYDLVAIAIFMAEGDPTILREALLAYGYEDAQLNHELSRRLLAWTFIHRFGNVAAFFDLLPTPTADTLPELATWWFGLGPSRGADRP